MTRPLIQIYDAATTETVVREMNDNEYSEWLALEPERAKNTLEEYKAKRAAEYPSFADQFDLLYHGGLDAWKAAIQAVKDKYPKPGA